MYTNTRDEVNDTCWPARAMIRTYTRAHTCRSSQRKSQFQKNWKATLIALSLDARGIYTSSINNTISNLVLREWCLPLLHDHCYYWLVLQTLKNKVSISTHSLLSLMNLAVHSLQFVAAILIPFHHLKQSFASGQELLIFPVVKLVVVMQHQHTICDLLW